MGEDWKAREQDLDAIAGARNADPFAVLGPHQTSAGWVIRVFAPEAISVRALTRGGELIAELPRTPTARIAKHRLPAGHQPGEYDAEA